MRKLRLAAILSTLCNLAVTAADRQIQFTVVPTLIYSPDQSPYGNGILNLNGSNLTFAITIPGGPWDVWMSGLSEATQIGTCDFFLPPSPVGDDPATTPLACELQGTVTLTDTQISEMLAGLWVIYGNNRLQSGLTIFSGPIEPVDSDGDGAPDYLDQCPSTPSGAIVNADGCSIEQLCPRDGPWRSQVEYLRHLRAVTLSFLRDGLITISEARAILKHAAHSRRTPPKRSVGSR
jgi:hypothetical protein